MKANFLTGTIRREIDSEILGLIFFDSAMPGRQLSVALPGFQSFRPVQATQSMSALP
ncbi:hypothetical protein [Comamonas brasiliensis]|uniref:hypothetical protein n=1 Tax=Comamonas brasiliensis TaxID=1812482 RepID=UPI001B8C470C|nr:hypothetical protein [Comamonas sp. PE63]